MSALSEPQISIPSICPPRPTCGKEMRFVSVTPTARDLQISCGDDHILEFTVGNK
jgi:hypothetical protein